ncbi:MAG: hypothetical protein ACI4RN_02735 [Oscillospiraceae bacterium]
MKHILSTILLLTSLSISLFMCSCSNNQSTVDRQLDKIEEEFADTLEDYLELDITKNETIEKLEDLNKSVDYLEKEATDSDCKNSVLTESQRAVVLSSDIYYAMLDVEHGNTSDVEKTLEEYK